jgi:hypothetical protein
MRVIKALAAQQRLSRPAPPPGLRRVPELPGRGAESSPRGPDGLPERRHGREQGGAGPGLRPLRDALIPAGLVRDRGPGIEGDRGEPGRLRQARPDLPTGPVYRYDCGRYRGQPMVRRGERRRALGDLPGPRRTAGGRAGPADRAAVAVPGHRQGRGNQESGPALLHPVRVGPLLRPHAADRPARRRDRVRRAAAGGRCRDRGDRRQPHPGRPRRGPRAR